MAANQFESQVTKILPNIYANLMLTFHAKASSKTSAELKPSVVYKYGPLFFYAAIASRFREALINY